MLVWSPGWNIIKIGIFDLVLGLLKSKYWLLKLNYFLNYINNKKLFFIKHLLNHETKVN